MFNRPTTTTTITAITQRNQERRSFCWSYYGRNYIEEKMEAYHRSDDDRRHRRCFVTIAHQRQRHVRFDIEDATESRTGHSGCNIVVVVVVVVVFLFCGWFMVPVAVRAAPSRIYVS